MLSGLALCCLLGAASVARAEGGSSDDAALLKAVAGSQRTDKERLRDQYRHPVETLAFFGISPSMRVIEIEPGSGWYTAILAPYLAQNGHYFAAPYSTGSLKAAPEEEQDRALIAKRLNSDPKIYGQAEVGTLVGGHLRGVGEPGSADVVLTFRNLHNWAEDGHVDDNLHAFFEILKPGGVLGVVDHRAKPATELNAMIKSGYVTEDYVIEHAKQAGFILEASSPVNDNPKDTKDYPDGVWDLPPTLRAGVTDRNHYLAIGESDRMTLRFRKPLQP
jgi:predicted methyltransferase